MIYTNEMINKINDKKQKREKMLNWIFIPIMFLIILIIGNICYQKYIKKDSSVNIFGFKFYTVMTGSMEPKYNIGDLIIDKKINQEDIHIGDVITYSIGGKNTVTHRIIEIVKDNGEILYRTKGDNNNSADSELVKYSQIQGEVFFKINKFGKIITEFISGIGIFILLLIIILSYLRSSRKEEKRIAREDARRRYNIPKYEKEKII